MKQPYLIKGGLKGGLRGDRHPPYQGGQGGSEAKSIFNLIITTYLNKKILKALVIGFHQFLALFLICLNTIFD
jgi:hypothetical protein